MNKGSYYETLCQQKGIKLDVMTRGAREAEKRYFRNYRMIIARASKPDYYRKKKEVKKGE